MNKCKLCGMYFEYKRRDRATKNYCGSCMANRHRFALKAACVEYKGGCCQLCGYNRCLRALSFHHVDPSQKDFSLGSKHCFSVEKIKLELDKCVCLCHNCHDEVENALSWDLENPILTELNQKAANWIAGEFSFNRRNWEKYHPALTQCTLVAKGDTHDE